MKKADIISILEEQLKVANSTIEQLNMHISELSETIEDLRKQLASRDHQLDDVHASLKTLETAVLQHKGALAKEQRINKGLGKLLENKSEKSVVATAEKVHESPKLRGNNNAKRNMHIDMKVEVHDIYPDCPGFDKEMAKELNTRESIRYQYIPSQFIKHIYRQHCYIKDERIVRGSLPQAPLLNSSYDGSFIAGIMELRYMYSMSVERITSYFNDHGFCVKKSTLNGLLTKTAGLLEKLYLSMRQTVLTDNYLGCDETYMKVQLPTEHINGKHIKKGYIWVVIAKKLGLVYYFYEDGSRSEKVILNLLRDYKGTIQSDGFAPYRKLSGNRYPKILRLPCLQHIKRKFKDAEGERDADIMIGLINELYHNEHLHRIGEEGWTEAKNKKWRRKYAPPILSRIKEQLKHILKRADLDPQGFLYKAAVYMNNEMDDVENIFQDGAYELDNNQVERYNRYISLSRKNSLFYGSHEGANNGALLYSLACSCRMQGINFFDYITDVMNQKLTIPDGAKPEAYRHLLPDMWKKAHL